MSVLVEISVLCWFSPSYLSQTDKFSDLTTEPIKGRAALKWYYETKTKTVVNKHKKFQTYRACKLPLDIINLFSGSVWHHFGPIFVAHKLKMRKTPCRIQNSISGWLFYYQQFWKSKAGAISYRQCSHPMHCNDCQEKNLCLIFSNCYASHQCMVCVWFILSKGALRLAGLYC